MGTNQFKIQNSKFKIQELLTQHSPLNNQQQDLRNWHNSRVRQISTICLLTLFKQSDAPYKTLNNQQSTFSSHKGIE